MDRSAPLLQRLFTLRVGAMLVRNTIASAFVFAISLGILWVLVERFAVDKVLASGAGFIVANAVHYVLGRVWVYRGTTRAVAKGYVLFLINGLIGLAITMGLMALLLELTPLHYMVARILVSVIAGLAMFVLNAVWNFRKV